MNKGMVTAVIAFLFLAISIFDSAWAGEVINNTCPVMGRAVSKDTPYKVEYKGETVGFCCAECVKKFKADPEKYMKKLDKKCMVKCPKCGTEIDAMREWKQIEMEETCPMTN